MKTVINTPKAPAPIGPYNQAILKNDTLFISGQIALNPETMELIQGDIATETRRCMESLKAILAEADMNFGHVVKSSIFLKDMHQFTEVNAVYGEYFQGEIPPARETVEVGNLPKFVNVEISMIAMR